MCSAPLNLKLRSSRVQASVTERGVGFHTSRSQEWRVLPYPFSNDSAVPVATTTVTLQGE
jgi:hypothetical protein